MTTYDLPNGGTSNAASSLLQAKALRLTSSTPTTSESGIVSWAKRNQMWIALAALYSVVGVILVFGFGVIMTDAISRVANASYVMRGREPHFAAIGFVWTPLPSLLMLPFLPLQAIAPPLLTEGLAANLMSAIAMSAAVRQMHLIIRRSTLSNRSVWVLTGLFALQPMIVFYGANGMSESLAIFGLLSAARALLIWLDEGITVQLVVCGVGIAIAYLSRYEAGLSFVGVAVIVAVVSYRRATSGHVPPMSAMRLTRENTTSAGGAKPGWIVLNELLLVGLPAALAFVGWALLSWVVTGAPFAQLSSEYGVREFIKVYKEAEGGEATGGGLFDVIRTVGTLQPLAIFFIVVGITFALIRRERALFVVAALITPAFAFNVFTSVTGSTLFLYRYLILVIPITVLALVPVSAFIEEKFGLDRIDAPPQVSTAVVLALSPMILFALTIPLTARNVLREERAVRSFNAYTLDREVAGYVDSLGAPDGSILTDSGTAFGVLLHTNHPDRFVITSDSDFRARVADLSTVSYILVPENTGLLKLDAINRRWPTLFESGPSANTLVKGWKAIDGRPAWRLFRVATSPKTSPPSPLATTTPDAEDVVQFE